jgi:signal peptidase I
MTNTNKHSSTGLKSSSLIRDFFGNKRHRKVIARVILLIAVFYLVLAYVITPVEVDGISMQPTLHTGNVMLVWEWPQTWATITRSQYIPKRGSIVVLKKTPVSGEELIKRVIGLPGDTVSISGGKVTDYNSSNPGGFNPDSAPYGKDLVPVIGTYNTQVPPGQIFVLGDNRNVGASIDSRSSIGSIQSTTIIGQAVMRIYPFDKITIF